MKFWTCTDIHEYENKEHSALFCLYITSNYTNTHTQKSLLFLLLIRKLLSSFHKLQHSLPVLSFLFSTIASKGQLAAATSLICKERRRSIAQFQSWKKVERSFGKMDGLEFWIEICETLKWRESFALFSAKTWKRVDSGKYCVGEQSDCLFPSVEPPNKLIRLISIFDVLKWN